MQHTEKEFLELKSYLRNMLSDRTTGNTQKIFHVQKSISRFEGLIDMQGDLTTPSHWYELTREQKEFASVIRSISNMKLSYCVKAQMIESYLSDAIIS